MNQTSSLEPATRSPISPISPAGPEPGLHRESMVGRGPLIDPPTSSRARVGTASLRQIVDGAVMQAEGDAIRRALAVTRGNKSQAARLLRTNYTTLHSKMRRYGIGPREFQR